MPGCFKGIVAQTSAVSIPNMYLNNIIDCYSVRKVVPTYTGDCMQVRNSSAQLAEIGFVNDYIDEASLTSHCGSGYGEVTIWYNQAPGAVDNLIEDATIGAPPKIVDNSGNIFKSNGVATVDCVNQILVGSVNEQNQYDMSNSTIICVLQNIVTSNYGGWGVFGSPSLIGIGFGSSSISSFNETFIASNGSDEIGNDMETNSYNPLGSQFITGWSYVNSTGTVKYYYNGLTGSVGVGVQGWGTRGRKRLGGGNYQMVPNATHNKINEVLIYNSTLTDTQITDNQLNMKNYFL